MGRVTFADDAVKTIIWLVVIALLLIVLGILYNCKNVPKGEGGKQVYYREC